MKNKKENLRQRAYLNTITSFIDYSVRILSSFIVNPFIIKGLGGMSFGVWQMLGQITNYNNLADLKVSTVLKWAIAKDRENVSEEELRTYVTTTFVLILCMLPFILIVASIITWFLPNITNIPDEYVSTVRITFVILIGSFIINKFFDVLEAILRGMNLGFKRMGLRAGVKVFGGGLSVLSIYLNFGLIGLAVVQVITSLIVGISLLMIIKKNVTWFGLSKFSLSHSKIFIKTSGWFMAWSFIQMIIHNSDKVLLGYFTSPILVSKYVITSYMSEMIKGATMYVVSGVLPGIGKLYGNKEYEKIINVKEQVRILTWVFCVAIGSMGLVFNQSFVNLWVGEEQFAGQLSNLLLILIVVQYMMLYNDSVIIDVTLNVKKKVYYGIFSAIITLISVFVLVKKMELGIIGLTISILLGRTIMSVTYPIIVSKLLNHKIIFNKSDLKKIFIITGFFTVSFFIGQNLLINNWIILVIGSLLFFITVLITSFFIGVETIQKRKIMNHFDKIKFFSKDN